MKLEKPQLCDRPIIADPPQTLSQKLASPLKNNTNMFSHSWKLHDGSEHAFIKAANTAWQRGSSCHWINQQAAHKALGDHLLEDKGPPQGRRKVWGVWRDQQGVLCQQGKLRGRLCVFFFFDESLQLCLLFMKSNQGKCLLLQAQY